MKVGEAVGRSGRAWKQVRLTGNLALLLGSLVFTAQFAVAAPVYSQPLLWTQGGTTGATWTSHVDASTSGWRAYDDFSLNAAAIITQATWYGVYLTGSITDGVPNTDTWDISFFADSANAPGTQLSNTTLTAAQVTTTVLGTGFFQQPSPVTVYQFTANLTPFAASAGTKYWFSPWSHATIFVDFFAMIKGSNGDSSTYQNSLNNGGVTGTFMRTTDRAFSLAEAPEPGTLLLLGTGFAAMGLWRRNRMRRSNSGRER